MNRFTCSRLYVHVCFIQNVIVIEKNIVHLHRKLFKLFINYTGRQTQCKHKQLIGAI